MTRLIQSLRCIESEFDVAVLDQFGVLHDGREAVPGAAQAVDWLYRSGKRVVVMSNSGKRESLNRERIAGLGVPLPEGTVVETSGETAWRAFRDRTVPLPGRGTYRLLPIAGSWGDAVVWAQGNPNVALVSDFRDAGAVLLMGMPTGDEAAFGHETLEAALASGIPVICSNPDRSSLRGDALVSSPGVMADRFERAGGQVIWFGKPYREIFDGIRDRFPEKRRERFVMIGDSILHDVAGAATAGFRSLFVRSGIHFPEFADLGSAPDVLAAISRIVRDAGTAEPDWSMERLA